MACDGCNCFLSFWAIFCTFTSITAWIMKISKKKKNACNTSAPKIIIICYTVPEIWCVTDVIVIFHFGLFFVLLPLTARKMKIPKKKKRRRKKPWRYHHFTQVYQNSWYMLYCSWDMVGDGCNCCFSFWTIFCPFTPLTAQKWKFQKNEKKKPWRCHFTQVYQNSWSYALLFLRYGVWQM